MTGVAPLPASGLARGNVRGLANMRWVWRAHFVAARQSCHTRPVAKSATTHGDAAARPLQWLRRSKRETRMMQAKTRQLTFRLPEELIERVDKCAARIQSEAALPVTRTDVVRMLLVHALDSGHCGMDLLRRARG